MTHQRHGMTWLNPPPQADGHPETGLMVQTAPGSDFWRHTQYGFLHDSGHALLRPAPREWTATVTVAGEYRHLYDQAGLMLRADQEHWMKMGVEFVGRQQWSVVVTHGVSDWSVQPAADHTAVTFRCVRRDDSLILHARPGPGEPWTLLRVAPFPPELDAQVGVMACSPADTGFRVTFSDFVLEGVDRRPLHDLARP